MCLSGYFKGTSFDLFFKLDSARQPLLLDHDFSGILSFDSCRGSRLQAFLATSIQCYKLSILQAFHVTRPSFFKSYSMSVFTQRNFTRKILPTFWALVSTKNDKQNTLWVPNYSKIWNKNLFFVSSKGSDSSSEWRYGRKLSLWYWQQWW